GLAETKNGAVVRKHFGYEHIPQHWANEVNALCRDFLNPYLNFHRPGLFPESVTDAQGKTRKRYPLDRVMTPFEKLKSIPAMVSFLKPSITLDSLEIESKRLSDNEAAQQLQQAKQQLFLSIHNRSKVAA
ncbi:MAG TPA: integrase, partial [Planctomycetota bacterium]|nr:integrase [Planctomycetota bacterium]